MPNETSRLLTQYEDVVGPESVEHMRQLAKSIRGVKAVHVNSTRYGGGVAEILERLIPMSQELGIDTSWEVIEGEEAFYRCTKSFHNAIQGMQVEMSRAHLEAYARVNQLNAERLRDKLHDADIVFIHDPQPAALLEHFPERKGKWVWRCHIDASKPYRPVWRYLQPLVEKYDASIWSLADFVQPLGHPQFLIPPSIDPLSLKNIELPESEINEVRGKYGIRAEDPVITQVSRFDRFKDPIGVIHGYFLAKQFVPKLQLILVGGTATDDPEGDEVLREVQMATEGDHDIHIIVLPPDAHTTINAMQRLSDVVIQKSVKEGFGLTVTEAMWKGKPVIGGNAGGIRLQVIDHHTGFLVNSSEGMALRVRYLLDNREKLNQMGKKAQQFTRDNFLITRHVREYLTAMVSMMTSFDGRIELAA